MQTGCPAAEGVHQQRDSFSPLRGIQRGHFYKTHASALSGSASVYQGYPVRSSDCMAVVTVDNILVH